MRVDLASEPGDPAVPNEDFCAVTVPSGTGGAAVVLDGVTAPVDGDTGCAHGTVWFVNRLGTALLQAAARADATLAECLAEALARTANTHAGSCDLTHKRTPQATVAAARWERGRLEYLVLGDCEVLITTRDGATLAVRDTRVEEVNMLAEKQERRAELARLPRGSARWHTALVAYQHYADGFRNAPGGFYTAAADPDVATRAVCGELTDAAAVALVSDGVLRWPGGDRADLLRALAERGGRRVIDEVRRSETARANGEGGKIHDDATSIRVEL